MTAYFLHSLFSQVLAATPAGGPATGAQVYREPWLGRYFARVARLEAASANSLNLLQEELTAHHAPQRLLRAVARAAHSEGRHARMATMLAHHNGAGSRSMTAVTAEAGMVRSLLDLALDNAVEGGVRHRYGALLGDCPAQSSSDPLVRTALRAIAEGEVRHAELLWQVSAWAAEQLDPTLRQQVAAVRRRYSSTLCQSDASSLFDAPQQAVA